jgi:hypothetical protein
MSTTASNPPTPALAPTQPLSARRFTVPVEACEVDKKENLKRYRQLWLKWMSWYEHRPDKPNRIESQINLMIFNDITYRSVVSGRGSSTMDSIASSTNPTLAYLVDQGYLLFQVLAIQKLLDRGPNVISIRRLLTDVRKNCKVITREVFVSGDGHPYDYNSWASRPEWRDDALTRTWGLGSPHLTEYMISKQLHETFDVLSGKAPTQRRRDDTIRQSIFEALNRWTNTNSAKEIERIRNDFIAHSADIVTQNGPPQLFEVRFSQIDELQRSIVRVERTLTDCILSIRVARDVAPIQPLGIFSGLEVPYATPAAKEAMHKRWDELVMDRNSWKLNVLSDLK